MSNLIQTIAEALSKKFVGQEGLKEIKTRLDKKVNSEPGKQLSTNDFDAEAKTKLDGIEEQAQKNKINQVKMNGQEVTPDESGAVDLKVEDLIEGDLTGYLKTEDAARDYQSKEDMSNYYDKTAADAEFLNESEVETLINQQVGKVYRPKGSVANFEALPSDEAQEGDVYNVLDTGANYARTAEGTWDKLSETVDLKDYDTAEVTATKYYGKSEADEKFIDSEELTAATKDFIKQDGLETTLADYVKGDTLSQDYYDKNGADEKFIDSDELTTATQDFVTAQDIAEAINNIAEFTQEETAQILDGTYVDPDSTGTIKATVQQKSEEIMWEAIPSVEVTVAGVTNPQFNQKKNTDEQGEALFENIPTGQYKVSIDGDLYGDYTLNGTGGYEAQITVEKGQTETVEFKNLNT